MPRRAWFHCMQRTLYHAPSSQFPEVSAVARLGHGGHFGPGRTPSECEAPSFGGPFVEWRRREDRSPVFLLSLMPPEPGKTNLGRRDPIVMALSRSLAEKVSSLDG